MSDLKKIRFVYILFLTVFFAGCSLFLGTPLDQLHGLSSPQNRILKTKELATVSYQHDVKPILESRCVVCHGCYDSPCQLDLSSHEGIERGAHKANVYQKGRPFAIKPTRLFTDAHTPAEWRKFKFFPILNERNQTKKANLEASLMYKMLRLKREYPQPKVSPLPPSLGFSPHRKQSCPKIEEFDAFALDFPSAGMPYGLPDLTDDEYNTLVTWLKEGAVNDEADIRLSSASRAEVSAWERFLNGDRLKVQLMSRYLYEHLFLANLYFDDLPPRHFFKLVRSRTPPGEPIDLVATRRPYDDPKVTRVYYRLQSVRSSILAKTHMPYLLNQQRMHRYKELFLSPEYKVTILPSYEVKTASNPFETFIAIPAKSRYRFLLDEAQFLIMNFIKGPVCRGQSALNVINERFWLVFINPEHPVLELADKFIDNEVQNLSLPAAETSNALPITTWLKYSALEKKYADAKIEAMKKLLDGTQKISLDLIWDGEGKNDNAALTIFRHFNNATVAKGFVGDEPKTVMVLGYFLLERIHYLLVSGYDIYGNVGHQINSRLYMDFLRMEGEFNFLTLLPEKIRVKQWEHWYREAKSHARNYGKLYSDRLDRDTDIQYKTKNPKSELLGMLKNHLSPVLNRDHEIKTTGDPQVDQQLKRLSQIEGTSVFLLPQSAILYIEDLPSPVYTLIHNNGMKNVSELFGDDDRLLPEEDNLTLVQGFLGAYPNAFYRIAQHELKAFVDAVEGLEREEDYQALLARFGVRRNDPDFWKHSDEIQMAYYQSAPIEAGLFDYSRLENR